MQLRFGQQGSDTRECLEEDCVGLRGNHAPYRAKADTRPIAARAGWPLQEFLKIQTVVYYVGILPPQPITRHEMIAHSIGNEDNGVCEGYRPSPNILTMRVPAEIAAMPGIDDRSHTRKTGRGYAVVQYKSVVHMQNVNPLFAQLARQFEDERRGKAVCFAERLHRHAGFMRFRCKLPGMRSAVDFRIMALDLLLLRQVNGKTFHPANFKAW
jgi:hypothetical protein